ncbi:glutamate--tRNA ligase [Nosocomiicoccus ampullae]|uniref:glutamate--tRNA ligase n=1 Tax=Nosocomiicoccus ampullae TaxID=489910 RepID=UPI001C5FB47D|nr:glutamate--tRNA ligase [Nosocomiicoccus ampullae]QYA48354.1 glutamate--tRNA ligase [Nosocomiicoccus ampullae]
MSKVRVRYAPSPTGYLHIGNARSALFNYLFARHYDGEFIIRIEDTDKARHVDEGEASQLNYLKWLGIDWDESVDVGGDYGPYRQSERSHIYKPYIDKLLEEDKAYRCYMTAEELEAEREEQLKNGQQPKYSGKHAHLTKEEEEAFIAEGREPSIRIRVPKDKTYAFNDMVKGDVSFDSNGIGDWVIVKKDGTPTYNFAVVIDDHEMDITHVLRGDDHISNTPRQLMVYDALGFEAPEFGHMTLIVNEDRKKLSKRDSGILQFIEDYEALGYLPEALFNFIALLGWTPGGEEEIFSKDEFIELFTEDRLSKSPAFFDKTKLAWVNNQYMKQKDTEAVFELALPFLVKEGVVSENASEEELDWAKRLVALYQPQMSYAAEIVELSEQFFKTEVTYDEDAKAVLAEEQVPELMDALKEIFNNLEDFKADDIKKAIKEVQKATGIKGKKLFMPIRVATTGETKGPELPNALELLGKDTVLTRIENVIKSL